jgi:hypothetical protein
MYIHMYMCILAAKKSTVFLSIQGRAGTRGQGVDRQEGVERQDREQAPDADSRLKRRPGANVMNFR